MRNSSLPASQLASSPAQTELVEAFAEGRANRRVLVGTAEHTGPWKIGADGVRRRLLRFPQGHRFVLDCWERNDYGTTRWRVVVCEALPAGAQGVPVPAVRPGVALLADIQGATRVKAFLAWLRDHGDRIDHFSRTELARIELHFQRMPLARLRATAGRKRR